MSCFFINIMFPTLIHVWCVAVVAHFLRLHNTLLYKHTMIYLYSFKTMNIELFSVFCSFKQCCHEILIHDFGIYVYKLFCYITVELVGQRGYTINLKVIIRFFYGIWGCIDFYFH